MNEKSTLLTGTSVTVREAVAQIQHEIWASWMRWVFTISPENTDGTVTISANNVTRWKRQTGTAYDDLTEGERDSDREQADKVMKVLHTKEVT